MSEAVAGEAPYTYLILPEDVGTKFRELRSSLKRHSRIVWGEHCSECAFPACYSSCEFYTPRKDLHCRRFAHGIERVRIRSAPDLRGLKRIQFRRWGKLEGSGPAVMLHPTALHRNEKREAATETWLTKIPLPLSSKIRIVKRLNRRRKRFATQHGKMPESSTFIIEGWLEHDEVVTMTVSMHPWDKTKEGIFQSQFTFQKGYNRKVIPIADIQRSLRLDIPFAIQIEVVGEVPRQPVIFGMVEFAELSEAQAPANYASTVGKPKTAKCVVWDLDDTVWNGILAEDGIEGLELNQDAVEAIKMLDARGILNSVSSKNDEATAKAALDHFGLSEYILFPQINWGPKSESIRRIAESLDIGIDTFVFVDDQPFERAEVSAAHAALTVMEPGAVSSFAQNPLFDVPLTAESGKRRMLYRDEEKRQKAATIAGTDYLGFLRSCAIQLEIAPVTASSAERIYELTQRTNQLNVTGARFSREQVAQFVKGGDTRNGFVLNCRDNFGDYGIIGFCVLDCKLPSIEAFFMSCRVQRKRVEHAFFAWLSRYLQHNSHGNLSITYRKTAKNDASVRLFQDLGFTLHMSSDETGIFHRSLEDPWPDHDIVMIKDHITALDR